jgi:3-dehydroquinate dehydratase-1
MRFTHVLDRLEPTLAAVISEPLPDAEIDRIAHVADVAEFRADKFPDTDPGYLAEQIQRLGTMPVLLTIRSHQEDGGWQGSEAERYELFDELVSLPWIQAIDIELATDQDMRGDITMIAQKKEKAVIVSTHNFTQTPDPQALSELLRSSEQAGADYTKIAAKLNTADDYDNFMRFTHRWGLRHGLISVGMGKEFGPTFRIESPEDNRSRLAYGFTGNQEVAPGQMSVYEMHDKLKKRYPDYAKLFD